MLTADTITDEQIRDLRASSKDGIATVSAYYSAAYVRTVCNNALDVDGMRGDIIEAKARAICAEILNARAKSVRP